MAVNTTTPDNQWWLTPAGDPAVDTQALFDIYDAIPARGGQIIIRDNGNPLVLDANVTPFISFLKPIFLRGETPYARIQNRRDATQPFTLNWGGFDNAPAADPNSNSIGVEPLPEPGELYSGISRFSSPNLTLVAGDWVLLMGDTDIPGQNPHIGGGNSYWMEVNRVARVDSGEYILSSPVRMDMLVNPRIQKLDLIPNCGMADLQLESTIVTSGATQSQSINIDRTYGFVMENVVTDQSGFGYTVIDRSANSRFSNFSGVNQPNPNGDYALVAGCCTNFIYEDSTWNECRHVFTTGATQSGTTRWNGTKNMVIRNVTLNLGGDNVGNIYSGFDAHPEASDIIFRNCEVRNGDDKSFVGFVTRAPNTLFDNCRAYGSFGESNLTSPKNTQYGLQFKSFGNTVRNSYFRDVWQGCFITTSTPNYFGGCTFENNTFENCETVGISWRDSAFINDNRVIGNRFINSGTFNNAGSPNIPQCLIQAGSGSGHLIRGNHMDKLPGDGHVYSMDLKDLATNHLRLEGNYASGYGTGILGLTGTNAATINTDWQARNYTDGS